MFLVSALFCFICFVVEWDGVDGGRWWGESHQRRKEHQTKNQKTKTQKYQRKEPEENEGTSSKGNGTISVPCDGTIGERRKKVKWFLGSYTFYRGIETQIYYSIYRIYRLYRLYSSIGIFGTFGIEELSSIF